METDEGLSTPSDLGRPVDPHHLGSLIILVNQLESTARSRAMIGERATQVRCDTVLDMLERKCHSIPVLCERVAAARLALPAMLTRTGPQAADAFLAALSGLCGALEAEREKRTPVSS